MENFRIFLGWCCPFSHIQYTSIPPFAGFSSLLGIFTAEFISFSQFQLHLIQSLLFFCYFVRYRENFHHKHLFFGSFAQNHCILFFSYKIWTPEWLDFHVIATLQNAPGKTVFFLAMIWPSLCTCHLQLGTRSIYRHLRHPDSSEPELSSSSSEKFHQHVHTITLFQQKWDRTSVFATIWSKALISLPLPQSYQNWERDDLI